MNEEIILTQIQTQESTVIFSLNDIERDNLSLFQVEDLPLSSTTVKTLIKHNILTLADLVSTPDETIKRLRNIGIKRFKEISKIKEKQIDEIYQARGLQRSFPEDKETLSLLSKLKEDFSYFSNKTEESIWYDICRESLAIPISNPFLSYEDLFSALLEIPENLLLLILRFEKLTNRKNTIKTEEFNKKTSDIPLVSLMINALKNSLYLIEKDGYYMKKEQ